MPDEPPGRIPALSTAKTILLLAAAFFGAAEGGACVNRLLDYFGIRLPSELFARDLKEPLDGFPARALAARPFAELAIGKLSVAHFSDGVFYFLGSVRNSFFQAA